MLFDWIILLKSVWAKIEAQSIVANSAVLNLLTVLTSKLKQLYLLVTAVHGIIKSLFGMLAAYSMPKNLYHSQLSIQRHHVSHCCYKLHIIIYLNHYTIILFYNHSSFHDTVYRMTMLYTQQKYCLEYIQ